MRLRFAVVAIGFLLTLVAAGHAAPPQVEWLKRLDDGERAAAAGKKDLLICFTGHGWCHYCTLLDNQVFKLPGFGPAADDFVLVELNFPSVEGDDVETPNEELRALYAKWKKEYLIRGVPVVVLADAKGRPFAYTGYRAGITPESFLPTLRLSRAMRVARDQRLAEADAAASPAERAAKLHAALETVGPLLGSITDRQNDPLLAFYSDVVAEITRLDADNSGHLREIYDKRIAARDAWLKKEHVFAELDDFQKRKDNSGAISYIDRVLPTITDNDDVSWRLEHARQVFLEWDHQYEKALANARRLHEDPRASAEDRQRLDRREAFNLINSGRIDEYAARWERRMAEAGNAPKARRKLLSERAQHSFNRPDIIASITAWREYREATESQSDDWENATSLLARELARANEHRQALDLFSERLEYRHAQGNEELAGLLLSIADAQRALGMLDEERQSLDAAEMAVQLEAKTAKNPRSLKYLQNRLAALRETLPQ